MHKFKYKNNILYCEDVSVHEIVNVTETPVYIYSQQTLVEHYRKLDTAFKRVPHLICYSVKSNSNIAICRALIKEGAGLDIVSAGELYRAVKAGAKGQKIVFAGVGKTDDEIEFALKKGILFFTVESISELENINRVAGKLKKLAPVALRINPEIEPNTHKHIATGKAGTKFGIDIDTARWIYLQPKLYPNITLVGLQVHIGSQITDTKPFVDAIKKVLPFVKEIKEVVPAFKYFDIGGGLGIVYKDEIPSTPKKFAKAILPLISKLGLTIIIEPGRFISGNAGILVTKVLYIKTTPVKNFIIVDAGMNDLLRPTLYGAYHKIIPLKKNSKKSMVADIVGPICETGDFLGKDRIIQRMEEGEYLAIMGAGAYGFAMSSNYNSRPRACEVLVNGSNFTIIRKRETYKDLIKGEQIPEWLK